MKLSAEQKVFLHKVCKVSNKWRLNKQTNSVDVDCDVVMVNMSLKQIPVKFGVVKGDFYCYKNKLTTLKNCPDIVDGSFVCWGNNLIDYFKNSKQKDFKLWHRMAWGSIVQEYPLLINIAKKYVNKKTLKGYLTNYPQTKLYLE